MAFDDTASATTITSPTGTAYTDAVEFEARHLVMHNASLGISITCTGSKMTGQVESHGASVTVRGNLSAPSLSACGNSHMVVKARGSMENPWRWLTGIEWH
jgi:hypothetical protein